MAENEIDVIKREDLESQLAHAANDRDDDTIMGERVTITRGMFQRETGIVVWSYENDSGQTVVTVLNDADGQLINVPDTHIRTTNTNRHP